MGGNTSVEVSVNGQDFTSGSGVMVELVAPMNVTSVSRSAVVAGSIVSVSGTGFSAARGVYCAMGGSSVDGSSWTYVSAAVASSTVASCTMPARGAGMRVVEVAMSKGGEMSRSGKQVEYVSAGSVSSVWPASGVAAGGTTVTLVGPGFVAGRTACKFGSAMAVEATVMSSTEAVCVAPAGARGASVDSSPGMPLPDGVVSVDRASAGKNGGHDGLKHDEDIPHCIPNNAVKFLRPMLHASQCCVD